MPLRTSRSPIAMKFSSTACLFLVVLLFNQTIHCGSTFSCIEQERQALLKFKQSLNDTSHLLSSWNSSQDCCNWKGVQCDGNTGHVVKLILVGSYSYWSYNYSSQLEANEVNSCLLELKYLNHLDLSGNNFGRSPIPKFFGSMAGLRYLNLSNAQFSGVVPPQLGNLSSLRVLDLNTNIWVGLILDDLTWVSRLSSLQYLGLSGSNLSHVHNLKKVLNMSPSLKELHLSECWLMSIHFSHMYVNSTVSNVQYLDLSNNFFEGKFPSFLRNMTSLRVLDLSQNVFNSSIPLYLENLKSLEHLNLGLNEFDDDFGGLLGLLMNQCNLKSLDVSGNPLHGDMSRPQGNLSGCTTYDLETLIMSDNFLTGFSPDWLSQFKNLKYLDVSINSFNGSIPESLWQLERLIYLDLSMNSFSAPIPMSLGKLLALGVLDLSHNQLNGTIPISIGQLSNLKILNLIYNYLEGEITKAHFANLSMLEELRISYNSFLTIKVRSDWVPPFQLTSIVMGSCKIGTQFPQWLRTQKKIVELDLSNASISGNLPEWLHELPLLYLDLSHNQISGPIRKLPSTLMEIDLSDNLISGPLQQNIGVMVPSLQVLYLADNLINGSIPTSVCEIVNLYFLDLSRNRLSGNLPHCGQGELNWILFIKLSSNKLSGVIPSSIGHCTALTWLHLNNNSLYGELPLALGNCATLLVLDLGENGFSGNIPRWIGEKIGYLKVLRLHKNLFNDSIPSQLCQLGHLQIMDFGDNNLKGTIPNCFGNLSGMIRAPTEYLARDHWEWSRENMVQAMKGHEFEYTTMTLGFLVNMDLSRNYLIGTIPDEITLLSGLIGLNLSHNNLRRTIPKEIGGLMSLESLDFSNNQLSGAIPQSMSSLNSISHLNLSYNNLSGHIPTGNQLRTLNDPSFYIGNSELCGDPLPRKCPSPSEHPQSPTTTDDKEKSEGGKYEKFWFYMVIMSGYATGLWGVLGVLLLKRNWRVAYFQFVDMIKDKVLLAMAITVAQLNNYINKIDG